MPKKRPTKKAAKKSPAKPPRKRKGLRDQWGRFVSVKNGKVQQPSAQAKLPPWRVKGKFAKHPLKQLARALKDKRIGAGDIRYLVGRKDVRKDAPAKLRDAVLRDVLRPDSGKGDGWEVQVGREREPGDDDFDDEPGGDGGDYPGSGADSGLDDDEFPDLDAWEEMLESLDIDERDFWELYEQEA